MLLVLVDQIRLVLFLRNFRIDFLENAGLLLKKKIYDIRLIDLITVERDTFRQRFKRSGRLFCLIQNLLSYWLPISIQPISIILVLLLTICIFLISILDDVLIDQLRIVDEKSSHLLFEELDPSNIVIFLVGQGWFVGKIWAFAVVWFELLLGGGNIVFCTDALHPNFIQPHFHLNNILFLDLDNQLRFSKIIDSSETWSTTTPKLRLRHADSKILQLGSTYSLSDSPLRREFIVHQALVSTF